MARKPRARLRALFDLVAEEHPELDAAVAIADGSVLVDGIPATNPRSLVRADAPIAIREERLLRGERKLATALRIFALELDGRVALDLGAAAGGFTRALLAAGAARVYAVDAGHGQLLGSLRQDPRVVNLERTNLARLDRTLVSEPLQVVTADLSYVSLATALPQLDVELAPSADLVALVKPQFELGLDRPPSEPTLLQAAGRQAEDGARAAGWVPQRLVDSPLTGARGSAELFLHARTARP